MLKFSKRIDFSLEHGTPALSVDMRWLHMETSFEVCEERGLEDVYFLCD